MRKATFAAILGVMTWASSPSQAAQTGIEPRLDERLFTTFAFLNVAGFDKEYRLEGMSPTRKAVRKQLEGLPPSVLAEAKAFYRSHGVSWTDYAAYSLTLSGPPDFKPLEQYQENPDAKATAVQLSGLGEELRRFYSAAQIGTLWKGHLAEYRDEAISEIANLEPGIEKACAYLRTKSPDKLVLEPNLLGSYNAFTQLNDRQSGTLFVITGPASGGNGSVVFGAVHEYLHTITRPLLEENSASVSRCESLMTLVKELPQVRDAYGGDFPTIVDESIVRALDWRIMAPKVSDETINREYRQGYVLERYFFDHLSAFPQSGMTFQVFYRDLLQDVDISKEEARWIAQASQKAR